MKSRVALGLLFFVLSTPAHAALGGDAASIGSDSVALSASREITRVAGVEIHVLRLPSGTLVHEYAARGKVFAIAWGGPVIPDLRRLLGAYFDAYVTSSQGRGTGHHTSRVVRTPDWIVQSFGHQNGFMGRAWLTKDVPAGFDTNTVRAW